MGDFDPSVLVQVVIMVATIVAVSRPVLKEAREHRRAAEQSRLEAALSHARTSEDLGYLKRKAEQLAERMERLEDFQIKHQETHSWLHNQVKGRNFP